MSDSSHSQSLVHTPTEEDYAFVEQLEQARALSPRDAQPPPKEPQLQVSKTFDRFFERVTHEVKEWFDEHKIDETQQQVLRARLAQTQERAQKFAKHLKTRASRAVDNAKKRVAFSKGDAAVQRPRSFEQLVKELSECEKEEEGEKRAKKIDEILTDYSLLVDEDKARGGDFYERTRRFRERLYFVASRTPETPPEMPSTSSYPPIA